MAAGGPVVEPSAENIIVTPICPHVLVAKSFVLAPDRRITAVLGTRRLNPAYLAVDGQNIPLEPGDMVTVRKSLRETRLVQLSNKSFYKTVHDKLGER
jgi:NAD+ kinase